MDGSQPVWECCERVRCVHCKQPLTIESDHLRPSTHAQAASRNLYFYIHDIVHVACTRLYVLYVILLGFSNVDKRVHIHNAQSNNPMQKIQYWLVYLLHISGQL